MLELKFYGNDNILNATLFIDIIWSDPKKIS